LIVVPSGVEIEGIWNGTLISDAIGFASFFASSSALAALWVVAVSDVRGDAGV
jgi:hypothetical protein